jgi:hypothetical protein
MNIPRVTHCMQRTAALALWILPSLSGAAPADLVQPCSRTVELAAAESGEDIVGLRLDRDVYAAASDTLADLRLVAGEGREVPYALEKVTETTTQTVRSSLGVGINSLRETGSNALEVVWSPVHAAGTPPPVVRGFTVETPLRDFERKLTVYGREGSEWRELVVDALLYDYTRFMDVRRVEVELPENRATQFRLVIEEITDSAQSPFTEITRRVGADEQSGGRRETFTLERRPMRIDRISAWCLNEVESVVRDVITDYGEMPFTVEEDAAGKQTIVTWTSHREPLTQVSLGTSSRNFSRRAELQAARADGVRTAWQTVAQTTLSAIAFRSFGEQHLAFDFGPLRQERYRIVIHNGDNPPLAVTAVRGRGITQRLVFLSAGSEPLRLVYGGADVARPDYETVNVLAAIRKGTPIVEARLGPAEAVSGARRGFSWKRLLNSPVFFGGAVVAAVLALAAMLYSAVKRTGGDNTPADG